MKKNTLKRPTRTLYTIAVVCVVLCTFFGGAPYYVKSSIQKWAKSQEFEIYIDGIALTWGFWKMPSVELKNVQVKNKGIKPTFTHIKARSFLIDPYLFDFFKPYMKDYHAFLKIEKLEIHFTGGNVLEADRIKCHTDIKDNIYKINNFHLSPFKIKLNENSSSMGKSNNKYNEANLILYEIKGEGQYNSSQKELELYLKAPPASTQMPKAKSYAAQAKGKIKFLEVMPYQKVKNPDDPGIRGKITYTIDNFSNFLHHLSQANLISTIAENLGTIIGYPVPRVDPFTEQAEIFTNAVSLDMAFKPDGIYVGPMKL